MKSLYIKDCKFRKICFKEDLNRLIFCFLFKSSLRFDFRGYFLVARGRKIKFRSFSRVVNRCYITNRSRSVLRFFALSRISLRELSRRGQISGIRQGSW